jgi:hypothetical protein
MGARIDEITCAPGQKAAESARDANYQYDKPAACRYAAVDPNIWYVQVKNPEGTAAIRKYTTAQLQKMLGDGLIQPKAKISHSETDGYLRLWMICQRLFRRSPSAG